MKKNKNLFIRTVKSVDFSVFCVDSKQKNYWDAKADKYLPYSSGQQIKRSIIENFVDEIGVDIAPVVVKHEININKEGKVEAKQKETTSPCDPRYFDLLIGGWMCAPSKPKKASKSKKDDDEDTTEIDNQLVFTRRSPLSISPMTPLHPYLAAINTESNGTFDRTENTYDKMVFIKNEGKSKTEITEEDAMKICAENNLMISKRKLIGEKDNVNGIFMVNLAIDLSRLFKVQIKDYNQEIDKTQINKLTDAGWTIVEEVSKNWDSSERINSKWLVLPKSEHESVAEGLARAIVNWRITSNQSRTFDIMPTLAVAVSTSANEIPESIRGDLLDDKKARLVVEDGYPNTKVFKTNAIKSHIPNAEGSKTAIEDAIKEIKTAILEYYK